MYSNNYNSYGFSPYGNNVQVDKLVTGTMKRVYLKMTMGLIVTALTALFCASSNAYLSFYFSHSWLMWLYIITEFGIVLTLGGAINKLSTLAASALFYVFAVVNGLMFSSIFLVYSMTAIVKTFFITSATFGAMSVYGYSTNRDLSKIGSFLTMALFGLVIAMLVNIFLHSSALDWIVSIVGVFIFVGLTAWDTQQVKNMVMIAPAESVGRLATLGALNLYLDFINLFLFLLRIFGGNRD